MKRVLMVAYYFPPLSTSGAMRPLGFCRHLPECGWAPRVVAVDPWTLSPRPVIDATLGRRVPAAVHVDRVGHPTPMAALVRWRDAVRRMLSSPARIRSSAGLQTCVSETPTDLAVRTPARLTTRRGAGLRACLLEHLFLIPDAQRYWYSRAIAAAASGERPDVVYATGGPWTSLLAGRALARRFGVPFVADFRDPWVRNPFRTYAPFVRARSRRLERAVCRAASHVVANTIELRDRFAADYPEMRGKFVAVSNGFDDEDGPDDGESMDARRLTASPPVDLWHFGTVYGKRSPEALLHAVASAIDGGRLDATSIRVHFVGGWELTDDAPASRLAHRLEPSGVVVREAAVPHRQCLALMRRAPVLLVIQPESPLQVPGKIFEYVATRRPMLVVGGEGATASLVARHSLGRSVPNDAAAIETLLVGLANGEALAAPPPDATAQFMYRTLTAQLAAVLDAAVGGAAVSDVAA